MREFAIISNKGPRDPELIRLNDLPGSGRFDVLCRTLNASIWLSHGLRDNVRVYLTLKGGVKPLTMIFEPSKLRGLRPDERSTAGWIKKILENYESREKSGNPGVDLIEGGIEEILKDKENIFWLDEDGKDISEVEILPDCVFILGDHEGFSNKDQEVLEGLKIPKVRIGSQAYLASQCIDYLNVWLD